MTQNLLIMSEKLIYYIEIDESKALDISYCGEKDGMALEHKEDFSNKVR